LVAKGISFAVSLLLTGACMIRSSEKNLMVLQWEAPVGRTPQAKIVVHVDELKEGDKGVLGPIENHPSMAHSIPNPIEIHGTVTHRPADFAGGSVTLKYPKYKLADARVADRLALAIVGKTTCICVARVPVDVKDADVDPWLARWTCQE
jgi:hypothetical protein